MGLFSKRKPAHRKTGVNSKIRKANSGLRGFSRLLKALSTGRHRKGAPRGMKY